MRESPWMCAWSASVLPSFVIDTHHRLQTQQLACLLARVVQQCPLQLLQVLISLRHPIAALSSRLNKSEGGATSSASLSSERQTQAKLHSCAKSAMSTQAFNQSFVTRMESGSGMPWVVATLGTSFNPLNLCVLVRLITILSHDMLISEEIIISSTRSHSREVDSFSMTLKALRLVEKRNHRK